MIKITILILGILNISNFTLGIVSDLYVNNADAFASIFNAGYIDNTISVSSTPTKIQIVGNN
jgi:hypothetical protein